MDKAKADNIQIALKIAVADIEKQFGVKFVINGGKFDSLTYTPKLTVQEKQTADGIDGAEAEFKKYAFMFSLKPEWFGKKIAGKRGIYTICGIEKSRHKYCVIARDSNGNESLFSSDTVRNQLSIR